MANYTSGGDLVNDILGRVGEPSDGSSRFDGTALQYLNRAYHIIWMGGAEFDPSLNENWWWLFAEANLVLTRTRTGTVNVNQGSADITFNSGFTASQQGRHIRIADVVYRVATHTGGVAAATIDSAYVQANDAAAPYTTFQLDITLASDFLRLVSPMTISISNGLSSPYEFPGREFQVLGVSNRRLAEISPLPLVTTNLGAPRFFAHIAENQVRFDRGPQEGGDRIRVDYIYMARPADLLDSPSSIPLVPLQYRHVLSDLATFLLLVDKNDDRATGVGAMARSGLQSMAVENRVRLQVYGQRIREFAPQPAVTTVSDEDFPRLPDSMRQTQ